MDEELSLLKEVKPVAAPPFLWTRIEASVQHLRQEQAPAAVLWAATIGLSLNFLLTFAALWQNQPGRSTGDLTPVFYHSERLYND